MPELPEVETVCRGLRPDLEGRRIREVRAMRPDLRVPFPADIKERLEGKRIGEISRRAKYILMRFEDGNILVMHLGMSGRVSVHPEEELSEIGKHDHFLLVTDGGACLVFNDPRRFGMIFLSREGEIDSHPSFRALGPEPLAGNYGADNLSCALAGRKTTIKAALLDQRVVAGLGNIYVCEALFEAGISPERTAGTLNPEEAGALYDAVRDVLCRAIEAGGSTLRDYRHADGQLGYFQHSFSVYDREGRACKGCKCDPEKTGGVRRMVQAGRSTFYCPVRQIQD